MQKLRLLPIREVNTDIKAFSSKKEKIMQVKRYEICLNSSYDNIEIYICVLPLPTTCRLVVKALI